MGGMYLECIHTEYPICVELCLCYICIRCLFVVYHNIHMYESCVCVHAYIYMYMYIYICIHIMQIYTYLHIHIYLPTYLPCYLPTYLPTYACTYMYGNTYSATPQSRPLGLQVAFRNYRRAPMTPESPAQNLPPSKRHAKWYVCNAPRSNRKPPGKGVEDSRELGLPGGFLFLIRWLCHGLGFRTCRVLGKFETCLFCSWKCDRGPVAETSHSREAPRGH